LSKPPAQEFEIAVIVAGIAGLASHISRSQRMGNRASPPMSLTSAQSGKNFRNWWNQR
jgi:hypothetical protein